MRVRVLVAPFVWAHWAHWLFSKRIRGYATSTVLVVGKAYDSLKEFSEAVGEMMYLNM